MVAAGGPPVPSIVVSNESPIIEFGITTDGKRSSYWRPRAGVKRPELFLEREAYGKRWHFSMHASGRWHVKESRKARVSWTKPNEVVAGYTRAVGIVQPVAVAHREDQARSEVVLVPVAPDAQPTTFSVFIERPAPTSTVGPERTPMARPSSGVSRWPPSPEPPRLYAVGPRRAGHVAHPAGR
jgi:hypothetical protein